MTHSPTPWEVRDSRIYEEGSLIDFIVTPQVSNSPLWREDLAFIVTAVNNHDALLEALEGCLEELPGCPDPRCPIIDGYGIWCCAIGPTRAAILAARGEA